ncbi:MAG: SAM-dependent methyltransferase [Coprococcus sp.]
MTLKAVKIIRNCQVLVLPAESKEKCVAYQIVRRAIPEIEDKTTVCLVMPMTKDKDRLEKSHREGTQKVAEVLDAGKDAAFLTLGDPDCICHIHVYPSADCRDGVSDIHCQRCAFFLCCGGKTWRFSWREAGTDPYYPCKL